MIMRNYLFSYELHLSKLIFARPLQNQPPLQYAVAYKMSELGALGISGGNYRGGNFFGNSSTSDGEKIFREGWKTFFLTDCKTA